MKSKEQKEAEAWDEYRSTVYEAWLKKQNESKKD